MESIKPVGTKAFLPYVFLLFIHVHFLTSNAEKVLHNIVRTGYYLESLLGQNVLHHFGNGVFGLIERSMDHEQSRKLREKILNWFRRDGFYRTHIGINKLELEKENPNNKIKSCPVSDVAIEQTWQSLDRATRRGLYALCTFNSISDPESHPLQRAKPTISARLRRLWADTYEFTF